MITTVNLLEKENITRYTDIMIDTKIHSDGGYGRRHKNRMKYVHVFIDLHYLTCKLQLSACGNDA